MKQSDITDFYKHEEKKTRRLPDKKETKEESKSVRKEKKIGKGFDVKQNEEEKLSEYKKQSEPDYYLNSGALSSHQELLKLQYYYNHKGQLRNIKTCTNLLFTNSNIHFICFILFYLFIANPFKFKSQSVYELLSEVVIQYVQEMLVHEFKMIKVGLPNEEIPDPVPIFISGKTFSMQSCLR